MADETNTNKIIKAMRTLHTHHIMAAGGSTSYTVKSADMAVLLAELETLRSERDRLRKSLKDAYLLIKAGARKPTDRDYEEYLEVWARTQADMADAALNTQPAPAAEWTPEIGQRVIVMREKDEIGHVVGKGENEFEEGYWFIEFREPNVGFGLYELHEFKPAD